MTLLRSRSTPAQYSEVDVVVVYPATKKRQTSSQQLSIYIHHPIGAISINPDVPLVPAAASLAIVQASVASIQNVTGLSVESVSVLQTSAQSKATLNPGVIAGPVVGGAFLIILILSATLIAWIM